MDKKLLCITEWLHERTHVESFAMREGLALFSQGYVIRQAKSIPSPPPPSASASPPYTSCQLFCTLGVPRSVRLVAS